MTVTSTRTSATPSTGGQAVDDILEVAWQTPLQHQEKNGEFATPVDLECAVRPCGAAPYRIKPANSMDPDWSGFALGLLFGAAKVMAIGTVGFGIAWWRARRRIRELEGERLESPVIDERLQSLEQGFDLIATQLDQLVRSHAELRQRLTDPEETHRLPERSADQRTG